MAVGEVASTLAHELNQPLGAGQLLPTPAQPPARAATSAPRNAHRGAAHGAAGRTRRGVIQRVNAFARKRELNLGSVDLTALVRRVVAAQEQRSARRWC